MRIMSDSLMPFQPEIDEPSNILPSVEEVFVNLRSGHRYVLFFTFRVSETKVDELGVSSSLQHLEYIS